MGFQGSWTIIKTLKTPCLIWIRDDLWNICTVFIVNDDRFTNWVCSKQNMNTSRAADDTELQHVPVSWHFILPCQIFLPGFWAIRVLESRTGCISFQIISKLNRKPFLSDASDSRTEELMILRMRDSAWSRLTHCTSEPNWFFWWLILNWFCANVMSAGKPRAWMKGNLTKRKFI